MQWAYGVTTVPSRRYTYLPRTLSSLADAGFPEPKIFIDGDYQSWKEYQHFINIPVCRHPSIGAYGNWLLGLLELYIRDPLADRYAMFQDDIIVSRNLRSYLEQTPYPSKCYLNLYTAPPNEEVMGKPSHQIMLIGSSPKYGWFISNQKGQGAVALVFDNDCITALLSSPLLLKHPRDYHTIQPPDQPKSERIKDFSHARRNIDGMVAKAACQVNYREVCHYPSLVQHKGHLKSTLRSWHTPTHSSNCFYGEEFDLLTLLQ